MHNLIAAQFRRPSGLLGWFIARKMERENREVYYQLEKELGLTAGQRVLEIGFGPGLGILLFLSRYNLNYTGVDFSQLMYQRACKKYQSLIKAGRLQLHCADFLQLQLADHSFERIFFANLTYFWPQLQPPFQKLYRLLVPGGQLVFYMESDKYLEKDPVCLCPVFVRHQPEQVLAALQESGFIGIEMTRLLEDNDERVIFKAGR